MTDNVQTIVGNLTGDPELRFTPSGAAVASFTIAVNRTRWNRETQQREELGTTFYRCSAWRQMAENVAESLSKGMRVVATGEVYTTEYERREGGKGLSLEMNVDEIGPSLRFATAKVTRLQRTGGQQGQPQGQPQSDPWGSQQPAGVGGGYASDEPPF